MKPTFEVDANFGKPTVLDKKGENYEEFPFKFKAYTAQQDQVVADVLEQL